MQFIKLLSDHLFSRTPHPPSEPSEPESPPPSSSDATSARRTEASSVRDAILPAASEPQFAPFEPFTQISTSARSYATRSQPGPGHRSVRRLLRQTLPQPGLGMPTLFRERKAMRNNTQPDEIRLLGGSQPSDPDGVRIVPGQSFVKKNPLKGITSLKPVDTLSHGARDSGPVRARGKQYFSSKGRLEPSQLRSSDVAESPERASKRRRVSGPQSAPRNSAILDDETFEKQHPAPPSTTSRQSPAPSQVSIQAKKLGDLKSGQNSEYRSIMKEVKVPRTKNSPRKDNRRASFVSSEDGEIHFTRNATEERRRQSIASNTTNSSTRLTSGPSVEIFNKPIKSPTQQGRHPLINRKKRGAVPRESPDELQGEATVGPVPTSLQSSKKEPLSTERKSSPSDIQPTLFTSSSRGRRGDPKNKKSNQILAQKSFQITFYRGGFIMRDLSEGRMGELVVNPAQRDAILYIPETIDDQTSIHIPLRKVLKAFVGEGSSRKIRLHSSKISWQEYGEENKFDMELSSLPEKEELCSLLLQLHIEVQGKESEWMDRAFNVSRRHHKYPETLKNDFKRSLPEVSGEEILEAKPEAPKRTKLSDALQSRDENSTRQHPAVLDTFPTSGPSEASNTRQSSNLIDAQSNNTIEIPVKKYNPSPQASARATRSMSKRFSLTVACDDDNEQNHVQNLNSSKGLQKWAKRPLVYPPLGKKKAEVGAQDIERLVEDEFLNDNLIGFYIRFLEDHLERCNEEASKRVYFFNSYFFATLTTLPKGKRGINYAGVQKWTRNVDLFSYEYIVVPINENAHWYVAIICNLPYLHDSAPASRPPSEVRDMPEASNLRKAEDQEAAPDPPKEEVTRQSLASMTLLDNKGSHAEESQPRRDGEWPEQEENQDAAYAIFSESSSKPQLDHDKASDSKVSLKKSRKPKKKASVMKYNSSQPIIITFDSLDQGRSPTICTLREYLYQEAKSKKGIEINKTLIKGMKARDIPLQPNFSDCGLYLLAYVEKFVQNPDLFIRKILQKQMSTEKDWPPLRSGLLRYRLRQFLEDLYVEQEQLSSEKTKEKTLMVDHQPLSYLLGSSARAATKADTKEESNSQVKPQGSPQIETKSINSSLPHTYPEPNDSGHGQGPANATNEELVIDVDQAAYARTDPDPRTNGAQTQPSGHDIIEVPDSQDKIQVASSKDVEPKEAGEHTVYVDDSDGMEEILTSKRKDSSKAGEVEVQICVPGTPPRSGHAA